jgi:hypothetical protein
MRILTPVLEGATLTVLDPGQHLPFGCAITLELVRDAHPGHVLQALEQRAKELLGGVLVAAALHEDIEDMIILVNRAPQVMALPVDGHKHLVEMPRVPRLGASMLQLMRVVLPTLPTPLAHGFMGDVDTAFAQQCLHVAVAQRGSVLDVEMD